MKHNQIFYDEASYLPDEVFEGLSAMLPDSTVRKYLPQRRSWFRRHEGAIILIVLCLTLLGLFLILPYIPMILWNFSTPLTHLIGGQ